MSMNSLHNPPVQVSQSDVYTDLNSLQKLKTSARQDSQAAIPEVARQFEAVMISMMIKNLRKTGMEDPIFNSQAMDSYRDMYDQQLGLELSKGEGIGFAKAIAEQIKYQSGQQGKEAMVVSGAADKLHLPQRRYFPEQYQTGSHSETDKVAPAAGPASEQPLISPEFNSAADFVKQLWPLAEQAGQKLGVSAQIILSQAALETGWGKHIIHQDGKSSYNLFNIKASQNWSGEQMEKSSMEFIHDPQQKIKAIRQSSQFKAYDSFAQSFDDYVQLIQNKPRYSHFFELSVKPKGKAEQSLHDTNYINNIHKAGYATDPVYADKVINVLKSDVIQNYLHKETKLALK